MRDRIHRLALLRARVALASACLLLAGCGPGAYRWDAGRATIPADDSYEVRRGDTLYSIAWRYGLDYRELARWNGVGADYIIHPGQRLRLTRADTVALDTGSSTLPVSVETPVNVMSAPLRMLPRGEWQWPARGAVLAKFGDANATGKGIAIGGSAGDPITAAADGRVVYAGSGLIGYGKLIILKHSEEYLSAYGHNDTIYVREGEQVKQGDRIAAMGRGPGNKPLLHFEIRVNGEAVAPLDYLPSR